MKRAQILSASAGSGKTFRLVLKYICEVLEHPECYRNILAVTFTNKATEEMKSRIIKELNNLAANKESTYLEEIVKRTGYSEPQIRAKALKARTKILHDYSRFTILTIDRFFQRILRAFINELSLDLNYNIELDTAMLLERSADSLIESISDEKNFEVKSWLLEFAEERLNEGSKWDMRKDLRILGGELFKDGVAKRIGENIDKQQLHAIINELVKHDSAILSRIKQLGNDAVDYMSKQHIEPSSFKGKNRSFVHCFAKYASGELLAPSNTIITASADITKWYGSDADANIVSAAEVLRPMLEEICQLYRDNIEHINTTKLLRENYRSYALLSDLYKSIDTICQEENIMVLDKTKEILSRFVDQSNAPFIYEKVGNRYDRYMIDEFQDTSVREWRNLRPLLLEALASNPDASVFIVGDIKQSIYRWRGGDWRLLDNQVKEDLGRNNVEDETLELNRRSLENIVKFNNSFIRNVADADNQHVNNILESALHDKKITTSTHQELEDIVARAYKNGEQKAYIKSEYGNAEVCLFDPKLGDSPFIEAIKDAVARGYRYKDILILVRGANDGRKVAKALYDYKNECLRNNEAGFNILTSDSLTIDSCDVIKFIIALLRLAIDPHDDIERGIYNGYLMRPYGTEFSEEELQLLSQIAHLSPLEALELIIEHFELHNNRDHIAYLQAIHEQILAYTSSHIADIHHYLAWWDERGCRESLSVEKTDDTIEITTIHKAKGLERDVVIIPYCKWSMTPSANMRPIVWAKANDKSEEAATIGEFPVTYGQTMENSAFSEEYCKELVMSHVDGINLLYVAITRAKKELYMYVPKNLNAKSSSSNGIADTTPLIVTAIDKICPGTPEYDESGATKLLRHCYGKKIKRYTPKADEASSKGTLLEAYPTHAPNVAIHYPTQRFVEEGLTPGTQLCNNGIKLHKVFEEAITRDDLHRAIKRMSVNCLISTTEADELSREIERAMQQELASEWFSGEWDDVKCEVDILHKGKTLRPDRVMIKGDRAVIVDYKFGHKMSQEHINKMVTYLELLRKMGRYTTVEGYIWYISLGTIKRV
ncbi:MAG: UvrD-helicase domain-containing protein [Alistipes sp.]|nr:UvrD-helicase domain-containing protein [Alistipes sp.]